MSLAVDATSATRNVGRWGVALAGAVSLAVAMGIGRFAFTPLLPMMLDDGVIDLQAASWLASANYLGYLVGALLCTFQPWIGSRVKGLPEPSPPWLVRAGLVATVVLTAAMALPAAALCRACASPPAWPARSCSCSLRAGAWPSSRGWTPRPSAG